MPDLPSPRHAIEDPLARRLARIMRAATNVIGVGFLIMVAFVPSAYRQR